MTRNEIGQLLSDQMSAFIGRKQALIEPEFEDDEGAAERLFLECWDDRRLKLNQNAWRD